MDSLEYFIIMTASLLLLSVMPALFPVLVLFLNPVNLFKGSVKVFSFMVSRVVDVLLICILFVFGVFFFPAIIVAKIIAYVKYGLGKRTKKGEELLEQIYGLKNFLKDFSIIKERKLEELYLQEHYLVYALTLGVNNKVDNEILDKIKKHINHK